MRTYTINLIRHGEFEGANEGKYIGHTNPSLSQQGRAELSQLRENNDYPNVQAIFTSPLKRCTETCEILYPEHTPLVIEELSECNFGEFENKTAKELENNELFPLWLRGEVAPPFGETSADFGKRVCGIFEKIVEGMMKSGVFDTAIITHGGVIGIILSAYGLPEAPMYEWFPPYGCGYKLRIDPSIWSRGKKFEVVTTEPENK